MCIYATTCLSHMQGPGPGKEFINEIVGKIWSFDAHPEYYCNFGSSNTKGVATVALPQGDCHLMAINALQFFIQVMSEMASANRFIVTVHA